MKQKNFIIAITLIILTFVFSVTYLFAGLLLDKHNGPSNAQNLFNKVMDETLYNVSHYNVQSRDFAQKFSDSLGAIENYKTVKLEINGKTIYSFPPYDTDRDISNLVKYYTSTQRTPENIVVKLSADIYVLNAQSVFTRGRLSFILILAGFFATIILIILVHKDKNTSEEQSNDENAFDQIIVNEDYEPAIEKEDASSSGSVSYLRNDIDENAFDITADEQIKSEDSSADDSSFEMISNSNEIEKDDDYFEEPEVIEDFPSAQPIVEQVTLDDLPSLDEQTLNDEKKEIKAEGFINDEELSNKEISIIVFKVTDINNTTPIGHDIEELIHLKQSENLIKLLKDDSYVLSIESSDLDAVFAQADLIYNDIKDSLISKGIKNNVAVGISSKEGRTISVDRLIYEAEQAAEHALKESDSPIIAFRADPEKYKEHITK